MTHLSHGNLKQFDPEAIYTDKIFYVYNFCLHLTRIKLVYALIWRKNLEYDQSESYFKDF